MVADSSHEGRTLGLLGATGIGVGAIVGGGILALAGVAFATTGPSAVLAFALNGAIAFVTALSFAELASRFPESGGTYTYARKVLTIEAAFAVGWVVWFASVVASVLYALGFAVFLVPMLEQFVRMVGIEPPGWIGGRFALLAYSLCALGFYTTQLLNASVGGGQWPTVGKVVLFSVLIAGGLWGFATDPPTLGELAGRFGPFFDRGAAGLVQAMGYTFIALQGFDLIAAVGGEVRDPERNIPRAMLLSLGSALVIYIPLLLLIVAVGSPDQSITALADEEPEILIAVAAQSFLGSAGYWLVVVAGVLSMLSALQANLLAASSFASTMAADRTLPATFAAPSGRPGVAPAATKLTAATIAIVLVAVPDVAGAGAAASLIFLVTFTLVHGISYLARKRASHPSPFRTVAFPLVPLVGGVSCLALGLYQALAVPSAGVLAALWLSAGAILYVTHLAPRARVVDASAEGLDPQLIRLRGRTPLLLVPIGNPESASTLVKVAEAIAPHGVSRIRLLTVVSPPGGTADGARPTPLVAAQGVLGGALSTALSSDLRPEALITIADDPWSEIARIAVRSRCDTVLLGVGEAGRALMDGPLERLIGRVPVHVVVLRAPLDWDPDNARRILVPSRLGREQSPIRARLIGNLSRAASREVEYLGILPSDTARTGVRRAKHVLRRLAHDEVPGGGAAVVLRRDDVAAAVVERAASSDLMILGLQRVHRRRGVFGERTLEIAERTRCPLLMISRGG